MKAQAGVISRSQLLGAGCAPHDIERLQRQRILVPVHRGVYAGHTGALTWDQRAWAAVLALAPAALADTSALRVVCGKSARHSYERIHVMISADRCVRVPANVTVVRSRRFDEVAQLKLSPPRIRLEEAALDVALRQRKETDTVAELAAAVGSGRTTAAHLRSALTQRKRAHRRSWTVQVLTDLEQGTCSVLEHGYLDRVERAHGLPAAHRQARSYLVGRVAYRDALYLGSDGRGLAVELDGRLHHEGAEQRDADLERDLVAATAGIDTVRLGWGQVFNRPCATARHVADLLSQRGWTGVVRPCSEECAANRA